MRPPETKLPLARSERLVIRDLPDETLVYDLDRDNAHCLNASAAAIWRLCNGRRSPAQIAEDLPEPFRYLDEPVVCLALEQLARDYLLETRLSWPESIPRITRREAVRRLGIGAAITIPLVTSIIAPMPAQAATCFAVCHPCTTGAECCSGVCANNPAGCPSTGMRCA
jgi:Coenzyme PQQ synthesis protein D (PqqD)